MQGEPETNKNTVESIHILNISELNKSKEAAEDPEDNGSELKKWLFWSLLPSTLFLIVSVFLRRFIFIVPLPPIVAWGTYKIMKYSKKLDRDHPLLK